MCGDLSDVDMSPEDPLAEANKNANDLKSLMDAACDFDAQGCNTDPVPQCSACYIHFEGCRNKPHFEDDGVTPKEMDIDACMDFVAHTVGECNTCDSDESKEAYKVRTASFPLPQPISEPGPSLSTPRLPPHLPLHAHKVRTGEHDPPGVSQPTHKRR